MKSSLSLVFFFVLFVGLYNYQVNCASSMETEDDSSKENVVEDPEPYTARRANEMFPQNRLSNQPEKPSLNSIRNPSNPLVEVAQLTYQGSRIRIFTDSAIRNPPRFFYDIMAQVDPKSISVVPNYLRNNVVTFTIAMWNRELHSKVLARVRSLPNFSKVTEQNIHVMPFSSVFLAHKSGSSIHSSITLLNATKSYSNREENLQFYLLCNTSATANLFVEHFRCNPGLELHSLHLILDGYGLDFVNTLGKGQLYSYNVIVESCASSSTRIVEQCSNLAENSAICKDCLMQLAEMEATDKDNTKKFQQLESKISEMEIADQDNKRIYKDLEEKLRTIQALVEEYTSNDQKLDEIIIKIEKDVQKKTAEICKELDDKTINIENDLKEKTEKYKEFDEKMNTIENAVQENYQELTKKVDQNVKDIQVKKEKHQKLAAQVSKIDNQVQEKKIKYQDMDNKINSLQTVVQEKTKSYAFLAQRRDDFRGQGSIITYGHVDLNEKGAFNMDTGFFTAPVKGIYYLSFAGLKHNYAVSYLATLGLQLVKSSMGRESIVQETSVYIYCWYSDIPSPMEYTILLEKGEAVAVKLKQGWLHATNIHMMTFTGFLVEARM